MNTCTIGTVNTSAADAPSITLDEVATAFRKDAGSIRCKKNVITATLTKIVPGR